MTLQVAIKAMRDDAGLWKGAADVCQSAANAAAGFTLSEVDLSWASSETGVLASYEEIRAKAERLLREGNKVYTDLSSTLHKVANEYERSDEAATRQFKGLWDPRR